MPDVWLISGIPGAGKTTVADLLARRFERAARVQPEELHDAIVAGAVFPGDEPANEMLGQLNLVANMGCGLARSYVDARFEAVMDYVVPSRPRLDYWLSQLEGLTVRFVVLNPGVDAAAARDAERDKSKRHATAHGIPLAARWAYLQNDLEAELRGVGFWVSTGITAEEAVEAILARRDEALLTKP